MMLNTKKKPFMAVILLLTSLGITTSCIDNSYDLKKDIDMTINVGGTHLAIPVGNTERITLDKIIEVEDGDDLQLVNGVEYHLLKTGTIDDATTDVKTVTVNGSEPTIEETVVASPSENLPADQSFSAVINKESQITAKAISIDEAVKKIASLTAKEAVELQIALQINASNTIDYNEVTISDLEITLPKFLAFRTDPNLEENILSIPSITISKGAEYIHTLYLTGYKFGENPIIIENQSLSIEEDIIIKGKANVTIRSGSTGRLSVAPKVVLSNMPIASITGIIQPTIEPVGSTVNLENLPDFLQDDATELDITNPIFTFIATNPLEAPVVLTGTMQGEKDGSVIEGSTVAIGKNSTGGEEIILNKGKNIIALSRLGKGGPEGSTNIKVSDISNLIKKIPDVVSVTLQPAVEHEEYYTVNLGETYTMDSSYDIDIPLSFGSGLKIVYEETLEDFDLDLEDLEIKKAIISLTADNTIPLEMEIKNENVSALDKNGNKITGITVTVTGKITEGKGGETAVTSQLEINLDETQQGSINQLDGLSFKVTAVSGQSTNIQLRSDQWMQLKEMKLKIPNGIKLDLN